MPDEQQDYEREDSLPPQRPLSDRRTIASKFESRLTDYSDEYYDDELDGTLMDKPKQPLGRDLAREQYVPPSPGAMNYLEGDSLLERIRPYLIIGVLAAIFIGLVSYFGLKPDVIVPTKSVGSVSDISNEDTAAIEAATSSSTAEFNPGLAVVEDNVATMGGYERLKRFSSCKARGVMTMDGEEIPFIYYGRRPNYYRLSYTMPDGVEADIGFDGNNLWQEFRLNGKVLDSQTLPLDEHQRILQVADYDQPQIKVILVGDYSLDRQTPIMEVAMLGRELLDGEVMDVVKILEEGRPYVLAYIGASSNLLVQTETRANGTNYRTKYSDYRKVDGISIPFLTEQFTDGELTSTAQIERLTHNPGLAPGFFAPPNHDGGD